VQHLGVAPSLGIAEPSAPALQQAISDGAAVAFDYQLPGRGEPLRRRVLPLRLHRAEGRWHLIAHDLERGAERVFLLSRVVGPVRGDGAGAGALSEAAESASRRVDAVIRELNALAESRRATVAVAAGSQAEARLAARGRTLRAGDGTTAPAETGASADGANRRIDIGTLDFVELASELAGFGDQAAVLAPAELRDSVLERLRTVREQHADPSPEGGDSDGAPSGDS